MMSKQGKKIEKLKERLDRYEKRMDMLDKPNMSRGSWYKYNRRYTRYINKRRRIDRKVLETQIRIRLAEINSGK